MKENHFCRCCLSEECYKDMANDYYFGKIKENYFEMLLNIFNINISNKDALRCLICEECVSKIRDAAIFKKQVLNAQESIAKNLSMLKNSADIDTDMDPKIENDEFDDFDDHIGDHFNDCDFAWGNTQQNSEKDKVFVIKLEAKQEDIENLPKYSISKKNNIESNQDGDFKNTYSSKQDGGSKDEGSVTKSSEIKRSVKKKVVTAKHNKDVLKASKRKLRELSETQIHQMQARENTLRLIQNSNLCLFRSLQNKFGCYLCKVSFLDLPQLREHSFTHTNSKTLARKVHSLRGLSYKNADISDLKCNLCSKNCVDLTDLTVHLKNEHVISFRGTEHFLIPYKLQNGFRCLICESKFNSYLRLSIHMNTHYTNNVCEICGQSYINRLSLRAHVHSMHKEKKCSHCPAIFLTNTAKVKHLKKVHNIHNSKRHCTLCNKTFTYTYLLEEHKIQEHGAKRQILNCNECGKTFFNINNLKIHIRSVHIKERNYPCTSCGMRFFTKCDQKRHERTHEDVRSFSCSYCESKFKSKDSWRRHLKRQHGHVFGEVS